MKGTQTVKGRISERFQGLGTVTHDMIEQRAKEISMINGRAAREFTRADYDQACDELTGDAGLAEQHSEEPGEGVANLADPIAGSVGHRNAPKLPSDEQRVAEQLVEEGVEEAEHHQMLAGSTTETKQNS